MRLVVLLFLIFKGLNLYSQEKPDTIHFPGDNLDLAVYGFIDANNSNDTVYICYHPCPFITRVSQTFNGMHYNDYIMSQYPMIIFKCESEKEIDFLKYKYSIRP